MRRLHPVLAVARFVDHEHAARVRRDLRVSPGQLQAARVHGLGVPRRLRQEELQPLDGGLLRLNDGRGPRQPGQRFVASRGKRSPAR